MQNFFIDTEIKQMSNQLLQNAEAFLIEAKSNLSGDVDVGDLEKYIKEYKEVLAERELASVTTSSNPSNETILLNRKETLEFKMSKTVEKIIEKLAKSTSSSSSTNSVPSSSSSSSSSSTLSAPSSSFVQTREYTLEDIMFLPGYQKDFSAPLAGLSRAFTEESGFYVNKQQLAKELEKRILEVGNGVEVTDIKNIISSYPDVLKLLDFRTLDKLLVIFFDANEFQSYKKVYEIYKRYKPKINPTNSTVFRKVVFQNRGTIEFQRFVLRQKYKIGYKDFGEEGDEDVDYIMFAMKKCIENHWNDILEILLNRYHEDIILNKRELKNIALENKNEEAYYIISEARRPKRRSRSR
jgi:hypothetical protein